MEQRDRFYFQSRGSKYGSRSMAEIGARGARQPSSPMPPRERECASTPCTFEARRSRRFVVPTRNVADPPPPAQTSRALRESLRKGHQQTASVHVVVCPGIAEEKLVGMEHLSQGRLVENNVLLLVGVLSAIANVTHWRRSSAAAPPPSRIPFRIGWS